MKFWQKIFVSMLALFLLVSDACIYTVVHHIYKYNLGQETDAAVREEQFLARELKGDIDAVAQREKLDDRLLDSLTASYQSRYQDGDCFFQLKSESRDYGEQLPFSSWLTEEQRTEESGERKISFLELKGKKYVAVTERLPEPYAELQIAYFRGLSGMKRQWDILDQKIMTTVALCSVCLMLFLAALLKLLLRPLEQLSAAARELAKGCYDKRVKVSGQGEIASLSSDFNDMAEKIGRKIQEEKEQSESKQRFIDNLSHEMRTPLTTIFGCAEMMAQTRMGEEERQEALGEIMRESRRLLELRDKLLSLTLLRQDEGEKKEVEISTVLKHIREGLRGQIREKKLSWEEHLEVETVYADGVLLESLLLNLLQNSVRACGQGGRIRIGAERKGGDILLRLTDDGRGMDEEQLKHITEPFYRADRARSRAAGGAGLGLALCRQIVENQGARMEFSSRPGEGTEVCLIFTPS